MKIALVLVCLFMAVNAQAKKLAVTSEDVSGQIKSCLVDLYIAQQKYFENNSVYTNSLNDLQVDEKPACKGVQISSRTPDKESFVLLGQYQGAQWTLDESKSLTQVETK